MHRQLVIVIQILLIITFLTFDTTNGIILDLCDCSNTENSGPIDFAPPPYCLDSRIVERPKEIEYKLYTKTKEPLTFTGYSCSQWLSLKEISTNLLFAHDTIFKKTVKQVSRDECWKTAIQPLTCDNQKMTKEGKTFKYVQEPEGEGQWMTTQRYMTRNCITQEPLWKNCPECPVQSAFGTLTNNTDDGFAIHNDITIVWLVPDKKNVTCDMKKILEGSGNITHTKDHGIIVDDINQIEILTVHNLTKLCNGATTFQVMGIKDTYVEVAFRPKRKKRNAEETINSVATPVLTRYGRAVVPPKRLAY